MNADIYKALEYANNHTLKHIDFLNDSDVIEFWESKDRLEWSDICLFASTPLHSGRKPYKFSLGMIIYSVEHNVYVGEYSEKLHDELNLLKKLFDMSFSHLETLFLEKYENVAIFEVDNHIQIKCIAANNKTLRNLFIEFLKHKTSNRDHFNNELMFLFPMSSEDQEIDTFKDINSQTFWNQIKYYKDYYRDNEAMYRRAVTMICAFYRWLISEFAEYNFFADSQSLTTELFFNSSLSSLIINNAYFTTYSNTEDLGDKPYIVFILRNMDMYSTRLKKIDHYVLNTRRVCTDYYRKLINKYVQNHTAISVLTSGGLTHYPSVALHFIEEVKAQEDYPNPDTHCFTTAEAILIRNLFEKIIPVTAYDKLSYVRDFFQWCQKCDYLSFSATFFDYLSLNKKTQRNYGGESIPDEDIKKISDCFAEVCSKDKAMLPYYAIFLIQLETEFRISQICNLKTSSIQPTVKNDQFLIYSNTKTSCGRELSQPICLTTKKIIESVIEYTEPLRNSTVQSSDKDKVFLRYNKNRMSISDINADNFRKTFQTICALAGVKKYSPQNLRDTHMTKAYEFILKTGRSDLEMGLLSKHSRIDTTKNHYIELELTKMLESTYHVLLGSRDINQHNRILETVPDNMNKQNAVEGGCGHCNSSVCSVQGTTPCLICNHFVTTTEHAPYFIKMIAGIDEELKKASIPHQIEDLTLMKKLYVNWLREIYLFKEDHDAGININ